MMRGDSARNLDVETFAEIFDIPAEMLRVLETAGEIRGSIDMHPPDSARVFDDSGRLHRVEAVAVHRARPIEDSYYLNDLVFGMPKAEPWTWWTDDKVEITHISAWAGERCLGITDFGTLWVGPSADFNIEWCRGGPPCVPIPIPARLQGRGS